jgi:quercetin 2,3-dioxygenase
MLIKARATPIRIDNGGFIAWPTMPGWTDRTSKDHGLGPLAMVVRSILHPGRLIAMHEHQNDEIVSWVPAGVMRHDDKLNGKLVIDEQHLMVMNAGHSFWHSEETRPDDPELDMLQIFVRPHKADLAPMIQFGPIDRSPPNVWRHLFGPEGSSAPFYVRNEVDFFDIRLDQGAQVLFPSVPGRDLWFYVFSGSVKCAGQKFVKGEHGLHRGEGTLDLEATSPGITVAFLVDPAATVTREGTVGDNRRIPPVILYRALQVWKSLWPGRNADKLPHG